jgi:hypothetical protein
MKTPSHDADIQPSQTIGQTYSSPKILESFWIQHGKLDNGEDIAAIHYKIISQFGNTAWLPSLNNLLSSLWHLNREEAILDEHHRSWRAAQYNPGRPQDHRQASGDVGMITVVKALLPKCCEAHMPISATLERSTNQCPRRLECGTRNTVRVIRMLHGQCHIILRFIVWRQLALLPPGCSPNLPTDKFELDVRNPLPSGRLSFERMPTFSIGIVVSAVIIPMPDSFQEKRDQFTLKDHQRAFNSTWKCFGIHWRRQIGILAIPAVASWSIRVCLSVRPYWITARSPYHPGECHSIVDRIIGKLEVAMIDNKTFVRRTDVLIPGE